MRHTTSSLAHTGEMALDYPGLYGKRLDFSGDIAGQRVFARALGPDTIEICTAASMDAVEAGQFANPRIIAL